MNAGLREGVTPAAASLASRPLPVHEVLGEPENDRRLELHQRAELCARRRRVHKVLLQVVGVAPKRGYSIWRLVHADGGVDRPDGPAFSLVATSVRRRRDQGVRVGEDGHFGKEVGEVDAAKGGHEKVKGAQRAAVAVVRPDDATRLAQTELEQVLQKVPLNLHLVLVRGLLLLAGTAVVARQTGRRRDDVRRAGVVHHRQQRLHGKGLHRRAKGRRNGASGQVRRLADVRRGERAAGHCELVARTQIGAEVADEAGHQGRVGRLQLKLLPAASFADDLKKRMKVEQSENRTLLFTFRLTW